MVDLQKYLRICRKFHRYSLPKIRFKELTERYKYLYRTLYLIDEDDINKASFVIFLISLILLNLFSLILTDFNILIIFFYSFVVALIVSYWFNVILFREVNKNESVINALLYLIKIDFSLIQKALRSNSDYCINFIKLIKNYNLPISGLFEKIFKEIHEGKTPEDELLKIVTPSEDFNNYLYELLINNFNYNYEFDDFEENSLEKKFKIYLREIESKISIIFFIGLFFPIGLCFFIAFQQVNAIFIILFIPIFLIFLNFLFRKFMKVDNFLIGLLREYSSNEKSKYDEFLLFLKGFAINLKRNISPEKAFINSYSQNRNSLRLLKEPISTYVSHLLNLSYTLAEVTKYLGIELKSVRYNFILDAIKKMIEENAFFSADKILEILTIIAKHRRLEKKLEIIIRGEKFKVLMFLFLLPIIIGAIGGMIPIFIFISKNLDLNNDITAYEYLNIINLIDVLIIYLTLLFSNTITSYYFLKVINSEKRNLIIFFSNTIFTLIFLLSFSNAIFFF